MYLFIYLLFIYSAPRLDLTVSFHHKDFIVPTSPWVAEDEPREGLAACIAKTLSVLVRPR